MSRLLRLFRADRWSIVAAVLLLAVTYGSLRGAHAVQASLERSSAQAFADTAAVASAALGDALQRDADLTNTARTLIETTPRLTNAQLGQWFDTLRRGEKFPGAFGMLYVERVPASDLASFAAIVTRDPPFGVRLGGRSPIRPVGPSLSYCLTRFGVVELPTGLGLRLQSVGRLIALAAPKLDLCKLPIGKLLNQASSSGRSAAASLGSLLGQTSVAGQKGSASVPSFLRGSGVAVTVDPVYVASEPVTSGPERRRAPTGWAISLYESRALVAPLLDSVVGSEVTLAYRNPDGQIAVLYRSGNPSASDLTERLTIGDGGSWLATFSAPAVTSRVVATTEAAAVLVLGVLFAALLAALVLTLSSSRRRALQLADERSTELVHQALHDSLTNLPNRALIFDRAEQMLARARHSGQPLSALLVDLDGFKDVNDTCGHFVGDELLREVAVRLRAVLSDGDTVGRLGGDEFVVLLELARPGDGQALAERLLVALRDPFVVGGERQLVVRISASIGISSEVRGSAEELLREADIALYEAKALGKDRWAEFEPAMNEALQERLGLESDLRTAIAGRQLFVEFQPIVELSDLAVRGAEALVRWRHPERGVLGPSEFIPLLEASGAIIEVGRFVLEQACAEAARWRLAGHDLEISVNVSARQLEEPGLVEAVRAALRRSRIHPGMLVLEITETAMMRDLDSSLSVLSELKALGVQLAVDDFGTGYSSLSYLQRFAADAIKIDASFVAAMGRSEEGSALVHTLLQLGRALSLRTVAEGVEEPWQLAQLRAEGCDCVQGFLIHRPLSGETLLELLELGRRPLALASGATARG